MNTLAHYDLIFDDPQASELITSSISTFSPALIEVVARDFVLRSPGCQTLPDSRILVMTGQGHAAMDTGTDLFTTEVLRFTT